MSLPHDQRRRSRCLGYRRAVLKEVRIWDYLTVYSGKRKPKIEDIVKEALENLDLLCQKERLNQPKQLSKKLLRKSLS